MTRLMAYGERALAAVLVCGLGGLASGQSVRVENGDVEVDAPGAQVRVDTPEGQPTPPPEPTQPGEPTPPTPPAEPSYWIGILGGEVDPALRSHLGLEGAGVLVREVVEDSPADKAGIREHDVLLAAGGKAVTDMAALAEEVGAAGQSGGEITIDLLRSGDQQQVTVKPATRPAPPVQPGGDALGDAAAGAPDPFEGLFGRPLQLRVFGPGVPLGGADFAMSGPGGTSIQVNTENGKTRVEVKRGDQTWVVDAADPESLAQLPPEVRPTVESLLSGRGLNLDVEVDRVMPRIQEMFGALRGRRDERQRQRLEELERQVAELRERLGMPPAADGAPAGDEPLDEAPPFNPDAPPAEIEIPAVEDE